MVAMKKILCNFDDLWERDMIHVRDDSYESIDDKEKCRSILTKFYNSHDENGEFLCTYKTSKNNKEGRLYAPYSLQGIDRRIRHSVAGGLVDIDIKNCHPTILQRIMEFKGMPCEKLKYYNTNRDKLLNELIEIGCCPDRDSAKRIILSIINGAGMDLRWSDWVVDFYNEMHFFLNRISFEYPVIYDKVKKIKNENVAARTLNYELTRQERLCLNKIVDYCKQKKYKIAVLCHDGIMLYKDKTVNYNIICEDLTTILNMPVVVKDMNEGIDTSALQLNDLPIPVPVVVESEQDTKRRPKGLLTYSEKKEEWEKTHFKVKEPYVLAEINDLGQIIEKKHRNFLDCYMNEYCWSEKDDEQVSFAINWLADTDIRTYDRIDFIPSGGPLKSNVYNKFDGLNIENISGYDEARGKIGLEVFLEHLMIMCGNDKTVVDYLVKYIASIVRCPYKKTTVCIVFKSDEGTGKSTLWDFVGNCILGKKYYVSSEKPADFVGNFNDAGESKILIALDDTSQKNTYTAMEDIKSWISRKEGQVRRKHKDTKNMVRDFANIIFCTNRFNIISIQPTDRRFMIIESCNKYADINPDTPIEEKLAYKERLYTFIDPDNPDQDTLIAIRDYLYNVDLTGFNPQSDRVITDAYKRLKSHSVPTILRFILDYSGVDKFIYMLRPTVYNEYKTWSENYNPKGEMCGRNKFYAQMEEYYTDKAGFITLTRSRGRKEFYRWCVDDVKNYMQRRNMLIDDAVDVPDDYDGRETLLKKVHH